MDHAYRLRLWRHYGRLGFALFAYLALTVLLQLGAQAAVLRWAPELADREWYDLALAMLPMYLIAFPLFLLLLPPAPPGELLPAKGRLSLKELALFFLMCLGILYPGNLLGQGLDYLLGRVLRTPSLGNPLESLATSADLRVYVLAAIVLGPILEELTFRKLLLDRMRSIDTPSALVFSALAFGLFHGNLIQFFYAFGVGLLFGIIYIKTGRVLYTMLLHVLVNAVGSLAALLFLRNIDLSDPFSLLAPALGMGLYVLLLLTGCLAGIVLMIKHRRRLTVSGEKGLLRPSDRVLLPFVNPGWVLFFFASLALMFFHYR